MSTLEQAPRRVVSLVPSITESLFELGVGNRLVGVTDYCRHPARQTAPLTKVGGPKTPDVELIKSLKPDLVIASREENRKEDVEALSAAKLEVWVTFPCTAREVIDLLWEISRRFQLPQAGMRLSVLETIYEWASLAAANMPPVKVFCPIWRADAPAPWWMTVNQNTYTHDLLRVCGGENIFADRERRYPLEADLGLTPADAPDPERDTRYPRVTPAEIAVRAPEVILLPSEPYAFTEADRAELEAACPDVPAVQNKRLHLVDGSWLTWPGTRLAQALSELPSLLQI